MAHHKRRRRKNARAGCLMCKPHKANGMKNAAGGRSRKEDLALMREREQLRELGLR